jgi:hypothetical protein
MKYLIKFCFIIIILSSCQLFSPKPESEAFYCKINGKGWRPKSNSYSLGTNLSAEFRKKTNNFNITAFNEAEYLWLLLITENNILEKKTYMLFSETGKSIAYYNSNKSDPLNTINNIISQNGSVTITKIEAKGISGTFEFKTYNDNKKKTYKITKGQFNDLAYIVF